MWVRAVLLGREEANGGGGSESGRHSQPYSGMLGGSHPVKSAQVST
jgi:hypothetical protein